MSYWQVGKIELLEEGEPKYAITYLKKAERLAVEKDDRDAIRECRFYMGLAEAILERPEEAVKAVGAFEARLFYPN